MGRGGTQLCQIPLPQIHILQYTGLLASVQSNPALGGYQSLLGPWPTFCSCLQRFPSCVPQPSFVKLFHWVLHRLPSRLSCVPWFPTGFYPQSSCVYSTSLLHSHTFFGYRIIPFYPEFLPFSPAFLYFHLFSTNTLDVTLLSSRVSPAFLFYNKYPKLHRVFFCISLTVFFRFPMVYPMFFDTWALLFRLPNYSFFPQIHLFDHFSCMSTFVSHGFYTASFGSFSCVLRCFPPFSHDFDLASSGYHEISCVHCIFKDFLLHHPGLFGHQNGRPRGNRYPTANCLVVRNPTKCSKWNPLSNLISSTTPPHPLFSFRSQRATSQLAGFRNVLCFLFIWNTLY